MSQMNIEVVDHDGVKLLRLKGELAGEGRSRLVDAVTDLLSTPNKGLILDLGGVTYVNSAGLGDLVRMVAQANVQETQVVLTNLSSYLTGVLETTRLNRFFDVCPTSEDALRRLG